MATFKVFFVIGCGLIISDAYIGGGITETYTDRDTSENKGDASIGGGVSEFGAGGGISDGFIGENIADSYIGGGASVFSIGGGVSVTNIHNSQFDAAFYAIKDELMQIARAKNIKIFGLQIQEVTQQVTQQVVAGINYTAKIKYNKDSYVFITIWAKTDGTYELTDANFDKPKPDASAL